MELSSDILEFIRFLNQRKVEYLIVGGWAVALHGRPRYTKDIDILIRVSPENADKLMLVLSDFGFASLELTREDFLKSNFIIQLGFEPNRIDLLTGILGVSFDEAAPRAKRTNYGGVELNFIGAEDLIANKTAVGRPQDLADVIVLKKTIAKEK